MYGWEVGERTWWKWGWVALESVLQAEELFFPVPGEGFTRRERGAVLAGSEA